jgi:hypothetical protein
MRRPSGDVRRVLGLAAALPGLRRLDLETNLGTSLRERKSGFAAGTNDTPAAVIGSVRAAAYFLLGSRASA